jgi:hypothetical protein
MAPAWISLKIVSRFKTVLCKSKSSYAGYPEHPMHWHECRIPWQYSPAKESCTNAGQCMERFKTVSDYLIANWLISVIL